MKSIRVRRYHRDDYNEVSMWYEARKLNPISPRHIPQIGYIVDGVACGYLVQTDNGSAFLEGFITNPLSDKEQRSTAIDSIAKKLIEDAKELGYTQLFAFTNHPTIIKAAKDNDFLHIGQYTAMVRGEK